MTTRLPQAASSRLRPPSRLVAPSVVTPVSKRRASSEDLPEQSPSKRSKRLEAGNSSSSLSSNEDSSIDSGCRSVSRTAMGPPAARAKLAVPPRNKMRRSVSMASIPLASGLRRAIPAAAGGVIGAGGRGLTRSTSKLSGSSLNINGRTATSSLSNRPPAGGAGSSVRRPGTNITNRINNSNNRLAGAGGAANGSSTTTPAGRRAAAAAAPNSATLAAPPLEKGRSKRPAWDLKGRLQDMESVVMQLKQERDENLTKLVVVDSKLNELHEEKQHLNSHLSETQSVKQATQQQLDDAHAKLREADETHERLVRANRALEETIEQRDRVNKELKMELDLKLEEIGHIKRSMTEMVSAKSVVESQLTSATCQLTVKEAEIKDLTQRLTDALSSIVDLKEKIMAGEDQRRKLHNKVLELKGNIRVFCRVRPLLGEEIEANGGSDEIHHLNVLTENSLELLKGTANCDTSSMSGLKSRGNGGVEFTYDRVFGSKDTQADVFEEVSQLVQSALDGYNVCVFAYGQTGSGKTHTMEGRPECPDQAGIIPRTVAHIFAEMGRLKDHGWEYSIEASFLEIYNETIRDLLTEPAEAKNTTYDIKLTDSRSPHTHVTNLKVVSVQEPDEIYELLSTAQRHRAVAATNMNLHSSRSHSVFRMALTGTNSKTSETCHGSLSLVDLAGSERLKESGSTGARLTETQNINKSLSNLGNVIMALGQKQAHVPYRNSKLTHLLQPSLGGNSKTLMLVAVSPLEACVNETLNSLRFATKVNSCHIGTASKTAKKV